MEREYKQIDISKVLPDKKNPRIVEDLKYIEGNPDNYTIFARLINASGDDNTGPAFSELEKSIISSGGILDPIIVVPNDDDTYTCIEGNTRLAIYNKHLKRETDNIDWSMIPALVYPDMDEKKIELIRLGAHFVGKKQWSLYAKGAYITQMIRNESKSLEEVIEIIGGSKSEIHNLLQAFADFNEFFVPLFKSSNDAGGGRAPEGRMSMFVGLNSQSVTNAMDTYGCSKQDFANWIKNKKIIAAAEDVRNIPKVLSNEKSRQAFLNNKKTTVRDAVQLIPKTSNPTVTLKDATIMELADELKDKIGASEISNIASDIDTSNSLQILSIDLNNILDEIKD